MKAKTSYTVNRSTRFLLLIVTILLIHTGFAQPAVGRIHDQVRGVSFTLFANGWMVQDGNPSNAGQTVRDPSGLMHLMIPAVNPQLFAYFLSWDNRLIEVHRINGARVIGFYDGPPPLGQPQIPVVQMNFRNDWGVETPFGFKPVPVEVMDENKPYGKMMVSNEAQAQQCFQRSMTPSGSIDREKFALCMVENMAGTKELEIFNCIKSGSTPEERTLCLFGKLGGAKERQIAAQLSQCYQQFGTDYSKYPLCMAGSAFDGDLAKLVGCMQQQAQTGSVSIYGTALCYGQSKLNLNPETQIILQCAVASNGNGYAFAGCAGGQLMAKELDKCLTNGIGGANGCFGNNNTIIKGLKDIGNLLRADFGPNNTAVQLWNQAVNTLSFGPNNDAVKTIQNIGNELGRTPNNIGKAIKKVVPKIKFSW